MKAVIFGAGGQDAHYLSNLLTSAGVAVVGVSRSPGNWLRGDVADGGLVERLLADTRPDYVFHLAASSTTRHDALFDNHAAISTGTLNILEAARRNCPEARIFLSGSALQFRNDGRAIDENTDFEARDAYSVSRIHSVYAGRYYRSAFGLRVYVGYFFNHDSPLRTEHHVNQKIVAAVKKISEGTASQLELGSLDVQKEFNFAQDVIEAVWLLVNQERSFEAVIGSGRAHSIREWVDYCFKSIGKDYRDYVKVHSAFKPEYSILVSNPALIRSLGWSPKVGFEALADLMLENPLDRRL